MNTALDNAISSQISWLARFENARLGLDRERFHEKAAVIAKLIGSYARRNLIDAHCKQLSELSSRLVEILYELKAQQQR